MSATTHMVPFHGHSITAIDDGGIIRIVMKPVCDLLGLDWKSQWNRIKRHPLFEEGMVIMTIPSAGGMQDMVTLTIEAFHGWLATIVPSRIRNAPRRDMLIRYQREAFRVITAHFAEPPQANAAEPSSPLGDMTGWDVMREKLALIRETRHVFGRAAAAQVWRREGLPMPDPATLNAPGARSADPLLLRQVSEFIEECCEQDPNGHVAARALFLAFDRWQMRQGHERISETLFGRITLVAGLSRRNGRIRTYHGLRLRHGWA